MTRHGLEDGAMTRQVVMLLLVLLFGGMLAACSYGHHGGSMNGMAPIGSPGHGY
jgi:hypothetical protein